jgi:hypothetical protein
MIALRNALPILLALTVADPITAGPGLSAKRQDPTGDLLERLVSESDMTPQPVRQTFSWALQSAQVPGGAVALFGCEAPESVATIPIVAGTPLRAVLDALVGANPGYRWQVDGGVLNLLPAAGEPSLLTTRIPKFHAKGLKSVDEAIGRLEQLPEVKQAMNDLGLKPGIRFWAGPINPKPPPPFDVACDGLTLREVLNEVVRRYSGTGYWEYQETHCGSTHTAVIIS